MSSDVLTFAMKPTTPSKVAAQHKNICDTTFRGFHLFIISMVRGMLLYKNGYQQTFNSTLLDRQWNSKAPCKGSWANFSLTGVSLTPDAPRGDKRRENTSLNVWREHTTQCREKTSLNVQRTHTQCRENTHTQCGENTHSIYREHITQCGENNTHSIRVSFRKISKGGKTILTKNMGGGGQRECA